MTVTMLHRGLYDGSEAARLLGVEPDQVVRWATTSAVGQPPVVVPTFGRAFSFADLVALRVALVIRRGGVVDSDLRRGVAQLRPHFGTERPLSYQHVIAALAISGRSLLADLGDGLVDIGRARQGVFDSVVRVYLKRIDFGADGEPERWRPAEGVVLDPAIQAGAPCLAGTRVPTATVRALLDEESAEDIALDFGIELDDIEAAVRFEEALAQGLGLAA